MVDNQNGGSINNQDLSYKRFSSFGKPVYLNKYQENPVRYSSIFSKLFFNIAIIIAIFNLFKHKKFYKLKPEVYFLSIAILYLDANASCNSCKLGISWLLKKSSKLTDLFNISKLLIKQ